MEFRIADTFTDSLSRLTGDEQKAVKTTAFDLQIDPASPGMNFHRCQKRGAEAPRYLSILSGPPLRAFSRLGCPHYRHRHRISERRT